MTDITRLLTSSFAASLLAVSIVLGSSTSWANEDEAAQAKTYTEHKFELAKNYYGECAATDSSEFDNIRPHLKAFTDMEVMADTMADPQKFAQLMAVVNDPRTMHVMSRCATEPVMWDTWMRGMTDFNKMSRVMTKMMNPGIYMNWMMAPMNPAMYQPMMKMADPNYYNRWMAASMNPSFYAPITEMANPNWYAPRINWMMNPQSMQPMFNMMAMPITMPQSTPAQ